MTAYFAENNLRCAILSAVPRLDLGTNLGTAQEMRTSRMDFLYHLDASQGQGTAV
jgi:hypothetical protein